MGKTKSKKADEQITKAFQKALRNDFRIAMSRRKEPSTGATLDEIGQKYGLSKKKRK